jgi:hypothetical protein
MECRNPAQPKKNCDHTGGQQTDPNFATNKSADRKEAWRFVGSTVNRPPCDRLTTVVASTGRPRPCQQFLSTTPSTIPSRLQTCCPVPRHAITAAENHASRNNRSFFCRFSLTMLQFGQRVPYRNVVDDDFAVLWHLTRCSVHTLNERHRALPCIELLMRIMAENASGLSLYPIPPKQVMGWSGGKSAADLPVLMLSLGDFKTCKNLKSAAVRRSLEDDR